MKRIMMLAVCVASLAVLGGEYDDYVKHNGGSGDAFVTATAWTPNGLPEPGKNYYVPANKTMTVGTSGATSTFGGDKLVVAGAVSFVGSGGTKVYWGDSEFLGGCSMRVWSLCQSYDTWRISGTESSPFTWIFGRSNKDKGQRELVNMHVAMKSAQTGYLKLSSNRDSGSIYGPLLDVSDCDFSEFFGTFRCLTNAFLRSSKMFAFPGALLFDGGEKPTSGCLPLKQLKNPGNKLLRLRADCRMKGTGCLDFVLWQKDYSGKVRSKSTMTIGPSDGFAVQEKDFALAGDVKSLELRFRNALQTGEKAEVRALSVELLPLLSDK